LKLFKPEIFQGNLKVKDYFEGWYFKHVSSDQDQVYAFIPGITLAVDDPHAFIQVINGLSGESHYITYPVDQFKWDKKRFFIQIGESVFADEFIDLNMNEPSFSAKGRLNYSGFTKYPKTLFSPGIMGWYTFMPFMECYHGVVSANHEISGILDINSTLINFNKGKGYIEKDWGISFPECWIWLQSNSFEQKNASLFISIAKIPWLGKFFIGFIAFIYFEGKFHKFATYNHSKLVKVNFDGSLLEIELENRDSKLSIQAKSRNSGVLFAPNRGNMNRRIKESIDSEVSVQLKDKNAFVIFSDHSYGAGLEIIEEIFKYI